MEFVITEFEAHVQVDHQTGEDAKRETQDVDARGQLMPAETAQGEKQLFLYHNAVGYDVGAAKMGPLLDWFDNHLVIGDLAGLDCPFTIQMVSGINISIDGCCDHFLNL